MQRLQPVILSGGSGTRLWPASRAMYPKQLLPLAGDRTMLQETALRLEGKAGLAERILVVCNDAHRFLVAEQLRAVGTPARIVLEPEGRNTAPAVALAAILTIKETPSGETPPLLLIMPADHVVRDRAAFLKAVEVAEAAASEGKLVTFGVVPTYPHTGYGYIEADALSLIAAPVTAFVEKPDKATAVSLLETNRFFWNAGIFLFRADVFIDELNQFAPDMVAACSKALDLAKEDKDFLRPDAEAFRACRSDSIDYALMEKTANASVVPLDAGWSDVGSWAALHDVSAKDEQGNALFGDVIAHDCQNSYIASKSRLVTAVGLSDFVVVEDKDSVLVAHKDRSQDVKMLVDELKRQGRAETELHRQVFRPWGSYDSIDSDEGFQVKRLIVNPGAVLSLQKHAQRAEHWTVVRGTARITLDDKEFDLKVNESTYIPVGAVHRIANTGSEPVHIIEVQCGDYLGEDDIVRLEDNYGRQGTNT
ncbi:MAG: mannose-1-phosphate guanylyltransferase/mannose-6-phosphate isomerase [Gammaproteobacteria bacterium]|nr:mannose-1-phosphate guanylyltransferase/mannose-6-phosphate isomerase [Gammaproteobacteria bacterium]